MIALGLAFIRSRLGIGKSELGVFLHIVLVVVYVLPILPQLDWDLQIKIHSVLGAFTFSSIVGRIENMKTVLKALKSIFAEWGKK